MFKLFKQPVDDNFSSNLFNQDTFYSTFLNDLEKCSSEIIIESPFITTRRINELFPHVKSLINRNVKVYINTRDPIEHDANYESQAAEAVARLLEIGVTVLYTVKHHRKLAIIDREIIWEGSLNILSYNDSSEIMRRLSSPHLAEELIGFINLNNYTGAYK